MSRRCGCSVPRQELLLLITIKSVLIIFFVLIAVTFPICLLLLPPASTHFVDRFCNSATEVRPASALQLQSDSLGGRTCAEALAATLRRHFRCSCHPFDWHGGKTPPCVSCVLNPSRVSITIKPTVRFGVKDAEHFAQITLSPTFSSPWQATARGMRPRNTRTWVLNRVCCHRPQDTRHPHLPWKVCRVCKANRLLRENARCIARWRLLLHGGAWGNIVADWLCVP
jgi:hypothetical protein